MQHLLQFIFIGICLSSCSKSFQGNIMDGRYYDPSNSFNISCDGLDTSSIRECDDPNQKSVLFCGNYGDFFKIEYVPVPCELLSQLQNDKKLFLELFSSDVIGDLKNTFPDMQILKSIPGNSEVFGENYFVALNVPDKSITEQFPVGYLFSFNETGVVIISGKEIPSFGIMGIAGEDHNVRTLQKKLEEKRMDLRFQQQC